MVKKEKQYGRQNSLMVFLTLACVNLIGNFSLSSQFGFYEDDYLLTIPALLLNGHDLLARISYALIKWPLGRPFFFVLQDSLSWLAGQTGGKDQIYLIGFVFTTVASFSVYTLLGRFSAPRFALLAAAAFALFPPDTAKQIFMHQVSFPLMTILTVYAITSYLDGEFIKAAIASTIILLTYEAYFLVLPSAALLYNAPSGRERWKHVLKWSLALACILFAVLTIRHSMGESRAGALLDKPGAIIGHMAQALAIGPFTMFKLVFARTLEGVMHGNGLQWAFALCVSITLWMACRLLPSQEPQTPQSLVWIVMAACAAIVLPYAYRFTPDYFPPHITIGRLSALHQVSAIGFALLCGVTLNFLERKFSKLRVGLILGCTMVVLFVPFSLEIQETQYVRNARQQNTFWQELLFQIQDVEDGMPIIVDIESGYGPGYDYRPGTEGFAVWWLMNYPVQMLPLIVDLPAEWKRPPQILAYWQAAPQWVVADALAIKPSYLVTQDNPALLKNGQFLLFRWENGHLQRSTKPIEHLGLSVTPKAINVAEHRQPFPLTPFGRDFLSQEKPLWRPLTRSIMYPEP